MDRRELLTSGVSALAVCAAGCAESGGGGTRGETDDAGNEATESPTTSASGTTADTATSRRPTTRSADEKAAFAVVAGYPAETTDGTDYQRETVFTPDDFTEVGPVEGGDGNLPPSVRVEPTDEAARRFVDVLTENGFTDEGVASCRWREDPDDPGWCLFTVLDGEVTYADSLGPGLASSIESGAYLDDPSFLVSASDASEAERLRAAIRNETDQ